MYNGDIWDQIYMKHINDAPWLSDTYSDRYSLLIDSYLPHISRGAKLLDYGCGNGKLAYHQYERGAVIDMAEISRIMIKHLRETYSKYGINVFETDYPSKLGNEERYDIIIAWMFFCNISPEVWCFFLKDFYRLMKTDSCIIIGGWDSEDPFIKRNNNISPYTERLMWPINPIVNYVGQMFEISANNRHFIKLSIYSETRIIRCIKLSKINKYQKYEKI